ncbi:hypothetical protein ACTWJ8_39790 (plasmid) [Streptomyces sp. SDT5-1]|uniref:hypothetical protein n=1 Tax=Streptomyces sp. SDT5-1 TaxID=3406418 RepID=UPI003FD4D445
MSADARPVPERLSEPAEQRAAVALRAVLRALGAGTHHLSFAGWSPDPGGWTVADATVAIGTRHGPGMPPVPGATGELAVVHLALALALEGRALDSAVLTSRTDHGHWAGVCAWRVRRGWLHPMPVGSLAGAVRPCGQVEGPPRFARAAPVLPAPLHLAVSPSAVSL